MVEKGSLKVQNILFAKNPSKKEKCEQKVCPLFSNSELVVACVGEVSISWVQVDMCDMSGTQQSEGL